MNVHDSIHLLYLNALQLSFSNSKKIAIILNEKKLSIKLSFFLCSFFLQQYSNFLDFFLNVHPSDVLNFASFVGVFLPIIDEYNELITFQFLLGKEVERKKFSHSFTDFAK